VERLRVADASVFPWIPSGPTAATAMAVGVNAAHLILQSYYDKNDSTNNNDKLQ
jgi:choline dehydrogenase-like flavoprotein